MLNKPWYIHIAKHFSMTTRAITVIINKNNKLLIYSTTSVDLKLIIKKRNKLRIKYSKLYDLDNLVAITLKRDQAPF